MKWRAGDLGRFYTESPKKPRFEVLRGIKGEGVEVWYGGSPKPTLIPLDTFRSDCIRAWQWEAVDPPGWLRPGVVMLLDNRTKPLYQAEVARKRWGSGTIERTSHLSVETKGQTFLVRSIRHDHVSCLVTPLGVLALIPIKTITVHGFRSMTAWDKISQEEDWMSVSTYDPEDDDFSDITVE
jgi:hypothetical protein